MIVTLFWIYRGLRRGLYPAFNMFLVFFLALLVALNYYGLAFSLVARIAPKVDLKMRECIAFGFTYFVSFGAFLYFCLWLCAENMKIHDVVDMVGGGVFGLAGGVVCSGVLMLFWFSTPFSLGFPVDDNEMFYRPNEWTLAMASQVGKSIQGGRPFSGVRFMRDIRYGLPGIPELGGGVYVASVPNGLRVFSVGNARSEDAVVEVAKYLGKTGEVIAPTEKQRVGDVGRTPVLVESAAGGGLIVVVDDRNRAPDAPNEFLPDGAIGFATKRSLEMEIVIRVYKAEQAGNIGSVIALFQPSDLLYDAEKTASDMQELLPSRACYAFDEKKMQTRMIEAGLPATDAGKLIPVLRHGGKVCFAGTGNVVKCAEVLGGGDCRVFEPAPPEDLDEKVKKQRSVGGR